MLVEERMKHDPVTVKRDLRQSAPSPATTLEVHELNYLLERLTIEAIMTKKVVTVAPETSLLDAAKLLLKHKIGCLPVVDNEELVGIITEGDMLRALVELQEKAADLRRRLTTAGHSPLPG